MSSPYPYTPGTHQHDPDFHDECLRLSLGHAPADARRDPAYPGPFQDALVSRWEGRVGHPLRVIDVDQVRRVLILAPADQPMARTPLLRRTAQR